MKLFIEKKKKSNMPLPKQVAQRFTVHVGSFAFQQATVSSWDIFFWLFQTSKQTLGSYISRMPGWMLTPLLWPNGASLPWPLPKQVPFGSSLRQVHSSSHPVPA